MLIGIDFDNTIVCYDGIFHATAQERGLIPADLPATKGAVRDHLRATGREDIWTEMQGFVYGPALARAEPFPGVWDFMRRCAESGIDFRVVSHKTRTPYQGPAYDLHASALEWLARVAAAHGVKLDPAKDVFLEPTKASKLARIGTLACDWFIDDLPEFLTEADFPKGTRRVLFDPSGNIAVDASIVRAKSWSEIAEGFFGPKPWMRRDG
jgi:hypothetical protein